MSVFPARWIGLVLVAMAMASSACGDDETTSTGGLGGGAPAGSSGSASASSGAAQSGQGGGPVQSCQCGQAGQGGQGGQAGQGGGGGDGGGGDGGGGGAPPPTYTCEPNRWVTEDAVGAGDGSAESPWTLTEAMMLAAPGDVVLVGPGTYVAPSTGERHTPAWNPAQSGTEGAPIVFCAEYPAVHHDEQRSELRNDAVAEGLDASPAFGTNGLEHIVWDGFYVDEANSPTHSDTGPVVVWSSRNVTIARSVIEGATIARDDNHSGIRIEAVEDVTIINNRISGVHAAAGGNRNHTGITTYDTSYVTIEHNEIFDCDAGMYLKGDHEKDGFPNGAHTVRFNYVHDVEGQGITVLGLTQVGDSPSLISQNLVTDSGLGVLFNSVADDHPAFVRVTHNTIGDCGSGFFVNAPLTLFDFQVTGNLVVGSVPFLFEDWADEDLAVVIGNGYLSDDNHAFGHSEWAFGRSLVDWQAFSELDGESSEGDPELVDPENGDYHLGASSPARTASLSGGPVGCYITGDEVIGIQPL